jgi:hypothetical protein
MTDETDAAATGLRTDLAELRRICNDCPYKHAGLEGGRTAYREQGPKISNLSYQITDRPEIQKAQRSDRLQCIRSANNAHMRRWPAKRPRTPGRKYLAGVESRASTAGRTRNRMHCSWLLRLGKDIIYVLVSLYPARAAACVSNLSASLPSPKRSQDLSMEQSRIKSPYPYL